MNFRNSFVSLVVLAALTGCGGGGGGSTPTTQKENIAPEIASFTNVEDTTNPNVTFTWSVSDANGDAVTCSLNPGEGAATVNIANCLTTTSYTVTYPSGGQYTAVLTASDGAGGTATSSSAVTVNNAPTITGLTATADTATPFQVNFAWTVADADNDAVSCVLSPGDGLADQSIADCVATNSYSFTYSSAGTYSATLTASDDGNGTTSSSVDAIPAANSKALTGRVLAFPGTASKSQTVVRNHYIPVANYQKAIEQQDLSINNLEPMTGLKPLNDLAFAKLKAVRKAGEDGTITRNDMVPARALVSLYLLSDVNFEEPVATVTTDESGNYEVRANDCRAYLLGKNLITDTATDDDIITAFRALGRLQVRALIVKNEGSEQRAIAIQSIADPNDIDETTGEPVENTVDPIVHRITKTIVDQIKASIESLSDLGLSQAIVDTLVEQVIAVVVPEIERVLEEAADSVIEIPEGQTFQDVVDQQENELEIATTADQLAELGSIIIGETDEGQANAQVLAADEVIADEDSTLQSSLDDEAQGLLSGLESALNEGLADEVDEALDAAAENGTLGDILVLEEGQTAEEALAASRAQKDLLLRETLQRFFLSMGLAVMVDQNEAGDAGVFAVRIQAPFQINNALLPGGRGFGNRNIRLFKIGSGDLDAGSNYTADPNAALGVPDANGNPQAPLYFAPALSSVVTTLLDGQTLQDFQTAVDAAFGRIVDPQGTPTNADFALVDRVRLYQQLSRRLDETSLVSIAVIDSLVANKNTTVKIKRLASVLASNFTWVSEAVNLTPEAFPIFTGRIAPLSGGASTIDSSELVRALSLTLGESASETAEILTARLSFYAQFAPDAIQSSIQRANFQQGANFDLLQTLLDVYPSSAAGYQALVIGNAALGIPATPAYLDAKERMARGLTSAVPATLFGQTLSSESDINIRSALFLMDFLMKRRFLINSADGFFTGFDILDTNSQPQTRFVPNFDNYKFMVPGDSVTVGTLVSSLLNITQIDNGSFFGSALTAITSGLGTLPTLPEFKEQNIDDFAGDLDTRVDTVNLSCTVERFDGVDPQDLANSQNNLGLSIFAVQYNAQTGEFFKTDALNLTVTSQPEAGEGPARRTYTVENIPSQNGGEYGLDYVLRFDIPGYQNNLPELFFYVDGFVPNLNICDPQFPLFIGPDQQFVPIPGIGLVSDQSRPVIGGDPIPEGIDLSNFSQPGAPLILTSDEEEGGLGAIDFIFSTTANGLVISSTGTNSVGFAPLFGGYSNGELNLFLDSQGGTVQPLFGLPSILGANVRSLVESIVADDAGLSSTIVIDPETFQSDRLYLMRDREGKYWIIELRFLDTFTDPSGQLVTFIDIGFALINNLGRVEIPQDAFDDFSGTPGGGDDGLKHYRLVYGDWLVLNNPSTYTGPKLLPPQEVAFGGDGSEYLQLANATDGVVIRYAGEHFDENISQPSDFDTVFGTPPDYSSVPVRIDAGREGITFVKLAFNIQERKYVMTPGPDNATAFTTNLKHNNIIAVFDNTSLDPGSPAYLARVIRDLPADDPHANFEIALDVIRFDPSLGGGEADVVCFTEEGRTCPTGSPSLSLSSDLTTAVGTVYDGDFDGVPAIFDPNDQDPNIPGLAPSSGGDAGGGSGEGMHVTLIAESDGSGGITRSFIAETFNLYPGEIQSILVESDIFGAEAGQQVLATCTPPSVDSNNNFTDYQCTTLSVAGGVTTEVAKRTGDRVGFKLTVPDNTLANLGDRVDFDFVIKYRAPTNLDGSVFQCGDRACPPRPNTLGSASVRLPTDLAVLDDLTVTVGTEDPQDFSSLTSLDVTREFVITGNSIPGAVEYEFNIFCAGSLPGEEFKPEESLFFFAPARDETGRNIQPEFYINAQFIGGRSCDFTLRAMIENNAGDFVGISQISFEDVVTSGGGDFFFNNEIKLALNQGVCLVASPDGRLMPATEGCTPENTLFTVADISPDSPNATLALGSGVVEAFADGGRFALTEGVISPDATIGFNVDLSGPEPVPPTCGAISTDSFSDFCANQGVAATLTDFFVVNADATEMSLAAGLPANFQIEGPVNGNGNIPLDQHGFYVLFDTTAGQEILEIGIDSFPDPAGGQQIWAKFSLTQGGSQFDGTGTPELNISSPGFMFVFHNVGQPVDFDVRYINTTEIKLAWFLPPPRVDIAGTHDINGDGTDDLTAAFSVDTWTFDFTNAVQKLEEFGPNGPQEISDNGDGTFTTTVQESVFFKEYIVTFSDKTFQLMAHFETGGNGILEWFEIFGGPGGPGGCPGCVPPAIDFFVNNDASMTLSDDATAGLNLEGVGSPLIIVNVAPADIVVSLPEGASALLGRFDFNAQQFETGSEFTFIRDTSGTGQNSYFLEYLNQSGGMSYRIDIFDTGTGISVVLFECPECGGGSGGPDGPGGFPDADRDGVPDDKDAFKDDPLEAFDRDQDGIGDNSDNCPHVQNQDQLDTNQDGIGDVCELTAFDLTGVYLVNATISSVSGAQCNPDDTQGASFQFLERWLQRGTLIIINGYEPEFDEDYTDFGAIDANGNITIQNIEEFEGEAESFNITALYNDGTGVITGTGSESNFIVDPTGSETLACEIGFDFTATPSTPADAGTVLNAGLFFAEGDMFFDGQNRFAEAEYSELAFDGTTTVDDIFVFDFAGNPPAWVPDTSDDSLMLGPNGWVTVPDVIEVASINVDGSATLQRTAGGVIYQEMVVELGAWDVSGLSQLELLPGYWPQWVTDSSLPFPTGSSMYELSLTFSQDAYEIECDNMDESPLDCKNIVSIGWDSVSNMPIPANSIGDLLTASSSPVAVEVDMAYEDGRALGAVFIGDPANIGTTGEVQFVIKSFDGSPSMVIEQGTWNVVTIGGETLLEVQIPLSLKPVFDLDEEELTQFFTVIPDTSDSVNYVRRGVKLPAGLEFREAGQYNDIAFGSIFDQFVGAPPVLP